MAKSTFLQLCQDARRECGISGTGPTNVQAQPGILEKIVYWVSYSDQEIQGRWNDWSFMHVSDWATDTVIGQSIIEAPANIGTWDEDSFFLDYSEARYKKLLPMAYKTWRDNFRQGVKINGSPSYAVIMPDMSITLECPPDSVYSFSSDYWRKPVRMTENEDTSPVPEEYERIIVTRAMMLYAVDHGATDILVSAQVEYDDLLDKMEAKYLPGQSCRRKADSGMIVVRPQ